MLSVPYGAKAGAFCLPTGCRAELAVGLLKSNDGFLPVGSKGSGGGIEGCAWEGSSEKSNGPMSLEDSPGEA